jgi:hypothetical protein
MKSLACRFGRHRWKTVVEGGEAHRACSACGKSPRRGGKTPVTSADVDYMKGSGQSDSSISSGF